MLIHLHIAKTATPHHRTHHMDSTIRTTSIMAHHNRCNMDTKALLFVEVIQTLGEVITHSLKDQTADFLLVKDRLQTLAIKHRRGEEEVTSKIYSGPLAGVQEVAGTRNRIARQAPIKGNPIVQLSHKHHL